MLSLVALLMYLIVEILRPEVILPTAMVPYSMPALAILMAVAWLVESATRPWHTVHATRFLMMLLLIATLSTAFVIDSKNPLTGFLELFKLAAVYLVGVQSIRTQGRLKAVQRVFTGLIVLLAVEGVMFSAGYAVPGFSGDRQMRLQYSGIFQDSNDLGQLYGVGWTLLFYDLVNGKNRGIKLLEVPALVFLSIALFECDSRGAILGCLLGFVLTVAKRIGTLIPMVAAFLVFVAMNVAGIGRMDRVSVGETSAENRIKAWGQGWYMLRSHPLLGVGPRKFLDHHPRAAHSSLVQVAAETGLFGLFCWVGFYFFAIRESILRLLPGRAFFIPTTNAPDDPSIRTSQLQAALIVCFFTGLFLSRAYVLLPYFVAALALSARNIDLLKDGETLPRIRITSRELAHVACAFLVCMAGWRFIIRHYVVGL